MPRIAIFQRWADCRIFWSSPDFFKLSPSPNTVQKFSWNVKSMSKFSPKYSKNSAFSQQKCHISFSLTKSNSGPDLKFWRVSQSGSYPNSAKFAAVRIQSNPSPVQWSSLPSFACACLSSSTRCSQLQQMAPNKGPGRKAISPSQ